MSKEKLKKAQEKAEKAKNQANNKIEVLGEYTKNLYDKLVEIQDLFDKIRNIPSDKKMEYEECKKIRLNWKQQADKIEEDFKKAAVKAGGAGAAGAVGGFAVAALGPAAAMGVATTFGVASTGTAISALSGAAATNAALAWLGGGALAAGGGGMAAGNAFLALAGPVGWVIGGVGLLVSGGMFINSMLNKSILEDIYTLVAERDENKYNLATVEINERISRIVDETTKLGVAIERIKSFGYDYLKMTEAQQYELGSYVNLMNASTQLLVNPILGLQPNYTEDDYNKDLTRFKDEKFRYITTHKKLFISLANLLYGIKMNDDDKNVLGKSLKGNKKFLESFNMSKSDFNRDIVYWVCSVL